MERTETEPLTFSLAPELASIVRPGVIWWSGATVVLHEHRLDPLLAEAEAKVRISPPAESLSVRTMYKKVGIDPTKTRPSNEALLRRVRKGDTIPRINSAVDVVNWCSLEFQLPYGLYDASKISGAVTMRIGAEGEKYPGIRKDEVNVGGRITVADDIGAFGNPTSDSSRTMVTPATTELLVIVYAPVLVARTQVERVLSATAERVALAAGGSLSALLVLDDHDGV
jgi:DNA/RNA-binding domain of Phe-tRNA-synthetase-like protein